MRRQSLSLNKSKTSGYFSYLMTGPAAVILLATSLIPMLYVLWTSFTNLDLTTMRTGSKWIGFENYSKALTYSKFYDSLWVTIKFTLLAVVLETVLGYLLAIFVHSFKRGSKTMRTLLLVPMLSPPITVALVWQTMFSNSYGIINQLLSYLGAAPVNWLQDVKVAFYAILWIDIWQYTPFVFLLMYVALQQMPKELTEAAAVDGASGWQRFANITLPYLSKQLAIVALLRTIDSFRLFDKINVLTKGGPADSTRTITMYIFKNGIDQFRIGFASATSILMTLVVLVLAAPYIRSTFKAMINR